MATCHLLVDRLQIELVLRNLISNAVEAIGDGQTEQGGPSDVVVQRNGAHHLRLVVADNGPGVAADVRERLFDPFFVGQIAWYGPRPCGESRHSGSARGS